MKRIFTIAAALLMTASVWAQAPEKMSYQAVVRDASNSLITTQAVGMQISILQGGATGTPVYVETQTPTTNANGLVSLEIGAGILVSGDFTIIDWANDTYFIKTETDPTGGTSYTITGTTQLMSVPYALHAKTAESITGTINYTETDPIFGASIANGITATDTTNWNNHTDSTAIANMGFVPNERIYFSAMGGDNNSVLPMWTSEKISNKIDTSGTANILKVQEAGLYFIACNIGIADANRNVNLYVNGIAMRQSSNFAGYSGGSWGQITANWSILLNANDLIELKISSGLWDGVGIDNLTIFKIN
jgi:hypothetical protein